MTSTRLVVDRRRGTDRRAEPRRRHITFASVERRQVVDRRRGAERRSTLERRRRHARPASTETPGEHLRNALQLLYDLAATRELGTESGTYLAAVIARVARALGMLERREP